MKKTTVFAILGLTAALVLPACFHKDDGHDGSGEWNNHPPGNRSLKANIGIDMQAVRGFTLAPLGAAKVGAAPSLRPQNTGDCLIANGTNNPDSGCIKLYALVPTGVVAVELFEPVPPQICGDQPCSDNGGMTTIPATIYNVGKFVLFVYQGGIPTDAGTCQMVILEKSSGALYCSQDAPLACMDQGNNCWGQRAQDIVQVNRDDGDIVYALGTGNTNVGGIGLMRFDFSNPASATSTLLFDGSDGNLYRYVENSDGDVISTLSPANGSYTDVQVFKYTGGFNKLSQFSFDGMMNGGYCLFREPTEEGRNLYLITPTNNFNNGGIDSALLHQIIRISVVGGAVTTSTYANDTTGALGLELCQSAHQASTKGRHFIAGMNGNGPAGMAANQFSEVYNADHDLKKFTVTALDTIVDIYGCDSQVIVRGRDINSNDTIVRFDPVTETFETVIGSADYTVTAVSVAPSCEITFGGRRAADNSRILGNVKTGSNELQILTNNLDGDIEQLVRIR